jgi:aminopeptidase N
VKTTANLLKALFTGFTLICILVSVVVADADNGPANGEKIPPSVIHQKMWEAKVAAHKEQQRLRALVAAEGMVNTQTNYDVLFYDIYIRVNDTTEIIYGKVTLVAQAAEDGVSQIQVDFFDNMTIDSIVAPSGALSYSRANNVVTVTLNATHNTGEQFDFDFWYHGHPEEGGFQAFAFDTRLGKKVISTLSEPYFARTWWPCKDRMDDKADSFHIAIEVDTVFYVGSNGTLDSIVYNGGTTKTFYYTEHYPMTTYLFSLAISDYTVWYDEWVYNNGQDTMPIVNACYSDRLADAQTGWGITPQALTIFSENYGLYPFVNEKYGHSNFEWNGGMEHQTMTSMTGSWFGFYEPVVVHELSHQWWGDMITCEQWGHIWLNEGWATYSEALYYLALNGWASYHNYMNSMDYTGGGTIYISDTTDVWNIFGTIVYDKGAWVVHMLRGVLGEALFFEGVHAYYNSQYQYAAATTEEFRDVVENATGVELDWFFEEWIYGEYRPNYHWAYWEEASDTGGYDVFVHVDQVQTTNPQVFTMPVDFFFDLSSGPDDTLTLWVDQRSDLFKFNFPSTISTIKLDPAGWVLKYQLNVPWTLFIITLDEELRDGHLDLAYNDTIEARGGTGSNTYSIVSGALPTGYGIDNNGVITGTTGDTGSFTFTVLVDDNGSSYWDEEEFTLYVAPTLYVPGDVNFNGTVNIVDLIYLVDYLFRSGPPPPVLNAADANGSCTIAVDDVTYLVDYMFRGGPAPVIGCVE